MWLLSFLPNNQTNVVKTPRINLATRGTPLEYQSNSTLVQTPEEILLLIADHLDETAKAALIRTCRYFHRLLEVNLYHRIAPAFPWRYHRNDLLFRTLEQRQDLLPFIRTYHGPLLPGGLESPPESPQKQSFWDRFKKRRRVESINYGVRPFNQMKSFKRAVSIFKKATNIEELAFTDNSSWTSDPLFEPIRKAVSEMSLRKLTLWRCEGMIQVLRDQPELEELSLGWENHGLEQLEKTDAPKLKALNASLREAALLVPGRPIERLSLVPGFGPQDFDESLFAKFLLSTTRILEFSIQLYRPWEDERVRAVIRVIARTLPGLERLTLTVEGQISGRVILDEIPSLPSIRYLTFVEARLATAADQAHSAVHDLTQSPHNDDTVQQTPAVEEWDDIFDRLRALCPSLVNFSPLVPVPMRLLSFLPNILHINNQTDVAETPRIHLVTRGTPLECQRNSTFTQIPEEILFLIADQLDETAKASLIRTCRYFHRLLEANLYRRITPGPHYRTDRLFRTLEQRQDLLPCIRTYHGPLLPAVLESPPESPRRQSFLGMFKIRRRVESIDYGLRPINETKGFKRAVSIFKQATSIEELDFIDYFAWPEDRTFEPIKKAVSEMSLRKLTLWDGEGMTQVLRDQPELEELVFRLVNPEVEQLERTDIPKLKALTVSLQGAALLVPGRPIERLSLLPGPCIDPQGLDEPLFDKFLLSTARILECSIELYRPWEDERVRGVIRAIARTLPGLERLTMTVEGPISGQVILEEIPSLPLIRYLTFSKARLAAPADQAYPAAHSFIQPPHNVDVVQQTSAVDEWDELFAMLRALCPSLVDVSYTPPIF